MKINMLSLTIIFLLPYLCNAVLYTVYVKTWNEKHAGTDDNIHISVLGDNWMYLGKLDIKGRADNDRSTLLSFRFYNDYSGLIVGGQLSCIMLFTDDDDAWLRHELRHRQKHMDTKSDKFQDTEWQGMFLASWRSKA